MSNILWIDEMPVIGRMYSGLMADFGLPYTLTSTSNYDSVDDLSKYDLVILDIDSTRFNGLALFKKIATYDKIPMIIASRMKDWLPLYEMNSYLSMEVNHIIIDKPKPIVNSNSFKYFTESLDLIFDLNKDNELIVIPELISIKQDIKIINQSFLEIIAKDPKKLDLLTPFQFEDLIGELFRKEKYEIVKRPRTRDGGIDLIAYKLDNFGKVAFAVECKKYSKVNKVGRPAIQKFLGAISLENVTGGIFITTSFFTKDAFEFINPVSNKIYLNDYDKLVNWLDKYK